MSDQTRQQLEQANTYIQNGQRDAARDVLESLVKTAPNYAEAWWLLAMVAATPKQMREALENVVRIQPDNAKARQQLDTLNAQTGAATTMMSPTAAQDPFAVPDTQAAKPTGGATTPPSGSQMSESLDELFGPAPTASSTGAPAAQRGVGPAQPYTPPPYVPPQSGARKQRNPLLYVLLGLVIALVCICGLCMALFGGSIVAIFRNPTVQALVGTGVSMLQAPDTLPSDAQSQGTLTPNQQKSGTFEPFTQQVWKYRGKKGEQITITATASASNLEVYLGLYDSSGQLLQRTKFGNTGRTQTLTATLTDDATYNILVGALGGATGNYNITVQSASSQ